MNRRTDKQTLTDSPGQVRQATCQCRAEMEKQVQIHTAVTEREKDRIHISVSTILPPDSPPLSLSVWTCPPLYLSSLLPLLCWWHTAILIIPLIWLSGGAITAHLGDWVDVKAPPKPQPGLDWACVPLGERIHSLRPVHHHDNTLVEPGSDPGWRIVVLRKHGNSSNSFTTAGGLTHSSPERLLRCPSRCLSSSTWTTATPSTLSAIRPLQLIQNSAAHWCLFFLFSVLASCCCFI